MKQWSDWLIDSVFQGVVGLIVFYVLKQICLANDFIVFAGVNPLSFVMVTILGIPGFFLVFAIGLLYFL